MTDFFFFEGIRLQRAFHTEESLSFAQNFLVKDDDVIIVTYPRSGTHWMLEIVRLIISKGDRTFVQTVKSPPRFPWIEIKDSQKLLMAQDRPSLMASHLPIQLFPKSYLTSRAKIIYVIRNPRDVATSAYLLRKQLSLKNQKTFDEYLHAFTHGELVYGSWFDHILGWLTRRNTENFLLMSYEELQRVLPEAPALASLKDAQTPQQGKPLLHQVVIGQYFSMATEKQTPTRNVKNKLPQDTTNIPCPNTLLQINFLGKEGVLVRSFPDRLHFELQTKGQLLYLLILKEVCQIDCGLWAEDGCPNVTEELWVTVQDLRGNIQKLCQFLGKHLSPEQLDSAVQNSSFSIMKDYRICNNVTKKNPEDGIASNIPLLRKGICGDWKNHFTVAQSEAFDKVYREKMSSLDPGLFPWSEDC